MWAIQRANAAGATTIPTNVDYLGKALAIILTKRHDGRRRYDQIDTVELHCQWASGTFTSVPVDGQPHCITTINLLHSLNGSLHTSLTLISLCICHDGRSPGRRLLSHQRRGDPPNVVQPASVGSPISSPVCACVTPLPCVTHCRHANYQSSLFHRA